MEGTRYFAVTDGQRWDVYETHSPVPINDKRIVGFDLKESSPTEVCLKALALWRPSLQSGIAAVGRTPVVGVPDPPQPRPRPQPQPQPPQWLAITDVNPEAGASQPRGMMFPDGSSVSIRFWHQIVIETTRWLIDNSFLTPDSLPIRSGIRNVVSTTPVHPSGTPMAQGKEILWAYVETKYGRNGCVSNARLIIKHAGQDAAQFKLRFS